MASPVAAQYQTQTLNLKPGWNAVYLEVEPAVTDLDVLLAGAPVETVWLWNRRFQSAQYLSEPSSPLPDNPDWLIYFPSNSPASAARSLNSVSGGDSYLIKLGGTRDVALDVTGIPVSPQKQWVPGSYNLTGFSIDPYQSVSFAEFFASEPKLLPLDLWRVHQSGTWERLTPNQIMQPGEAFFLRVPASTIFQGNLIAGGIGSDGVAFRPSTSSRRFSVKNAGTSARQIFIEVLDSDPVPPNVEVLMAGPVPVAYTSLESFAAEDLGQSIPLPPGDALTFTLEPGQTRELEFQLRSTELAPPPSSGSYLYQSLLRITDGAGSQIVVPVSATGSGAEQLVEQRGRLVSRTTPSRARNLKLAGDSVTESMRGLWIGEVTINKVAQVGVDPNMPVPTDGSLSSRLILHASAAQQEVRLLQQVTMMSRTENGQPALALVTDDKLLGNYKGLVQRGSQLVGQRFSSVAFPFFQETGQPANTLRAASGAFEDGSASTENILTFRYAVEHNDQLNPFLHKYHPDHDNLNAQFAANQPLAEGVESFKLEHEITLRFQGSDPDPLAGGKTGPQWLGTEIGGVYEEKIYGLFRTDPSRSLKTPITVRGYFRLRRITDEGVLNP